MFDNLNNLEASISAIRAFNHLIVSAVQQGDDFSYVAGGIELLLGSQVNELERLHHAIRNDFSDLKQQVDEFSTKLVRNSSDDTSGSSSPVIADKLSAIKSHPGADYFREAQMVIGRLHAEGKSIDDIAVLTGLVPERVRIFIEGMPERVKLEIAERMQGVDTSEIAESLNLKKATVERVRDMLLGKSSSRSPHEEELKAVNK